MIHDLILNDVALSSFGGWLTKVPPVVIAGLRGTWDTPGGRDGDTFHSEGCYASYECELEIHLEDTANIDKVNAWLRSATRMRVTPNLFYNHVSFRDNSMEWSEWEDIPDNGADITLTAHVQPWRYIWPEAEAVTIPSGESAEITAPDTRSSSQPLITAVVNRVNLISNYVSGGTIGYQIGPYFTTNYEIDSTTASGYRMRIQLTDTSAKSKVQGGYVLWNSVGGWQEQMIDGEVYTLTYKVKCSKAVSGYNITPYFGKLTDATITTAAISTDWQTVTMTGTYDSARNDEYFFFVHTESDDMWTAMGDGTYLYFADFMINYGDTATDYPTGDTNTARFTFGAWGFTVHDYAGTVVIDCAEKIMTNASGTKSLLPYVSIDTTKTDRWPSISIGGSVEIAAGANTTTLSVEPRWRTR